MMNSPANVQLLCLDVDGVMTDGSIIIDDNGIESKRFHVRDGTGIRVWLKLGYQIAFITGRRGSVVQHRAKELGVQHVVQGSTDKAADFRSLIESIGLNPAQTAMLGDDLPDLSLMKICGYPMAVADAVPEILEVAKFTTTRPGGHAAVREAIEHLLSARNERDKAREMYR